MSEFFAETVLLPAGWTTDVRITVSPAGDIESVLTGADPAGAERLDGVVVPGMPNLHSHAFQRAMAGLAEAAGCGEDGFWGWRRLMYRFVSRITPPDLEAIAAQLYIEMLKSGYTAVGEFHYLHHDTDGRPYAETAEMSERIVAAARTAGIGLTLLPVLYEAGDFGAVPPEDGQARFVMTVDDLLTLITDLHGKTRSDPGIRIGIAPHSLRAVTPDGLAACLEGLAGIDGEAPVHMHVAEQVKEVEDCRAWSGARPVEWLLANAPVGAHWCLIHATHLSETETEALARSGAVAGLCPSTEANLGDGLFPLVPYLEAEGRFGIGSDSHVSVSPVEELRWLEYGQRLHNMRRAIGAGAAASSAGARLYRAALDGGMRALGRPLGAIAPGHRADLVILAADHPALAARGGDQLLDSFVFSGNASPVRDVMAGGRWAVRHGRHSDEEAVADAYRKTLTRLM